MSEMITRTYSKPFHEAELHYIKGKRESAFEKELVKRYHSFIDKMSLMQQRMKPLAKRYYHEQHIIEQHDEKTKGHVESYTAMREVMKKLKKESRSTGVDMNEFHELRDSFHKETERYLEYHTEMVDPWREMTAVTEEEFYKLYKWFDKEGADKAHHHFDDYGKELYKNYDNYALDLCQWDENVDDMHGKMDNANEQWRDLFDLREKTVAMYIPVAARVTEINELYLGIEKDIIGMNEARMMFNN